MIKCEECGKWFGTKRGLNIHYRIHKNIQKKEVINSVFDFNEIKVFITSEIQKALKELNFSKPISGKEIGIVSIKTAKKMPKFDPVKVNKHLVVKELKEQIAKGIKNILVPKGSFDNQINFLEIPIEILA